MNICVDVLTQMTRKKSPDANLLLAKFWVNKIALFAIISKTLANRFVYSSNLKLKRERKKS